ncbi:hypothetical protein ABID44_000205 [Aquamicrobium ahrensii]|uniref:Uncharacterized protein n=1 Tax=Aquamicrobium ahrensii TaxID=469551 RepID=A0ABV2KH19_9HYPH
MHIPTWLSPALLGAGTGAVALVLIGFNWGGWVSGSTARRMAYDATSAAVTDRLTPYCLERARADPRSAELIAELKAANGYDRRVVIERSGWATPPGSDKADIALALVCGQALITHGS